MDTLQEKDENETNSIIVGYYYFPIQRRISNYDACADAVPQFSLAWLTKPHYSLDWLAKKHLIPKKEMPTTESIYFTWKSAMIYIQDIMERKRKMNTEMKCYEIIDCDNMQ